jgi:hypothetical protein
VRAGRLQTFNHVYYRVPLPGGMEEPAGQRPEDAGQLSIINVRTNLVYAVPMPPAALAQRWWCYCTGGSGPHLSVTTITWLSLKCNNSYGLQDISGAFRPNVLTAFMGETGAGKVPRKALCIAVLLCSQAHIRHARVCS